MNQIASEIVPVLMESRPNVKVLMKTQKTFCNITGNTDPGETGLFMSKANSSKQPKLENMIQVLEIIQVSKVLPYGFAQLMNELKMKN